MTNKRPTSGSRRSSKEAKTLTKSEQMSLVGSRDTSPELLVRKLLAREQVRFRIHHPSLPGKPDLYIPRLRLAIFVNGCFWHGHGCPRGRQPKTNRDFWLPKLQRNAVRDAEVKKQLGLRAIEPVEFWTCQLNAFPRLCESIARRYRREGAPR